MPWYKPLLSLSKLAFGINSGLSITSAVLLIELFSKKLDSSVIVASLLQLAKISENAAK